MLNALVNAREFLPQVMLAGLFAIGAGFVFFESMYLADQAVEFSSAPIRSWTRVFRAIAIVLIGCSAVIATA